jgi:hypothetical protein
MILFQLGEEMESNRYYLRNKLYGEVWSEPVSSIAKRYGVSDVSIHKTCKKLHVPVPPRGYWAKRYAGYEVKQEPLPTYEGPEVIIRQQRYLPALPKKDERLTFLEERERTRILQICDHLAVKATLRNAHSLVKQDQIIRKEYKRKDRERKQNSWNPSYQYGALPPSKLLAIEVLPEDLARAYRIFSTVLQALEDIKGSIEPNIRNGNTRVMLLSEPIDIFLKSREHNFILVIDENLAQRKYWRDTKNKQVESKIGSFIIEMLTCAHALRVRREERKRVEELRSQQELIRLEREKRQREEIVRFNNLEKAAQDWQRARVIEQYVLELEKVAHEESETQKKEEMLTHVDWAKEKIAWLDPIVAREDPVLGKKYNVSKIRCY